MIILLSLATILLILAAALVFGLPYALFGQRAFDGFYERQEYRVMCGLVATAALGLVCAPFLMTAMASGGDAALMFAENLSGFRWNL